MQNIVYERKRNGADFILLHSVTTVRFGNRAANVLVTEKPQYFVVICIFFTWQNTETMLISNGLRFIFTCPLFLAQPITFHDLRHSFATHRLVQWYKEGADVQTLLPVLSTYLGHSHLEDTSIYLSMTHELLDKANICFKTYVESDYE